MTRRDSLPLNLVPLRDEHLADAAALFTARYKAARRIVPSLPPRHESADVILPKLRELPENAPGVAALRDGRLVGFLQGQVFDEWRGKRTAYCPEWAHAAEAKHQREIYRQMYAALSAHWVKDRCFTHLITMLTNEHDAVDAFFWLEFGLAGVDALRDLTPLVEPASDVALRPAGPEDTDSVLSLIHALEDHISAPPVCQYYARKTSRDTIAERIADPAHNLWLACVDGSPVACLDMLSPKSSVLYIIADETTANITKAFTSESFRGRGLMTALLNHVLDWSRANSYERCAVGFEPPNFQGSRFWLKHFQPVCYSLIRHLDERIAKSHSPVTPPVKRGSNVRADIFPAQSSVLDETVLLEVVKDYRIPSPRSCHFLCRGDADIYRVKTAAGNFYLKISRPPRTLAMAQAEAAFVTTLSAAGVPVVMPVPSRDGPYGYQVSASEGMRPMLLFEQAPPPLPGQLDEPLLRKIGTAIALVHAAADEFDTDCGLDVRVRDVLLAEHVFYASHFLSDADAAYLRCISDTLGRILQRLPRDLPDFGLCHADLVMSNVRQTSEGEITLFDFGEARKTWRTFELAVVYGSIAHRYPKGENQLWQAFLHGYESVRPLPQEFTQHLPLMLILRQISFISGNCATLPLRLGTEPFESDFLDNEMRRLRDLANDACVLT